jgi:hypothetical protein
MTSIASIALARHRRSPTVPPPEARAALGQKLAEMRLQQRDAEVRAHEHAHAAARGNGVIVYQTVVGPDGVAYAVGGGISVDLAPVPGDPEATLRKAKAAIQAAYAVGMPSAADMKVAAEAYQLEIAAQKQIDEEQKAGGVHTWYA